MAISAESGLIPRKIDTKRFKKLQNTFPVTAILGARQCGKTTFARQYKTENYFDLENPRDLAKLANPQLSLENLKGLIVIDEIQRKPDLFPLLRYQVDNFPKQKYLILGSASRDLIKQSSESLAGRIGYYHLSGFRPADVPNLLKLWLRGGYPRAYLAKRDENAIEWLEQYITTFMERDIPQLGITLPAAELRRFWTMISHYHGQLINYSELARSFGISDMTARRYTEILEGTFMVRLLRPWHVNIGKRLVKAPKLYFNDSGIFHRFQGITSMDNLYAHSKLGASFEGFAIESVCNCIGLAREQFSFYRTHTGAELDLLWQHQGKNWGIEIKFSDAPKTTKSMRMVMQDLQLQQLWIVHPGKEDWKMDDRISAKSIYNIKGEWNYK
jgi:predicted AAA+ superfamily ATPase